MTADPCQLCRSTTPIDLDFTFAFQPIVEWSRRRVFAYEALVRGADGSGAGSVLAQVDDSNRYDFDQRVREKAIGLATALLPGDGTLLSINVMPNAIYDPARCLASTLRAAKRHGFPLHRLMFEMTEHEEIADAAHLTRVATHYASVGFTTAIDDFGSGFANLKLLTEFVPHLVKVDRELLRGVDIDPVRRAVLAGVRQVTEALGIRTVAEGVETVDEFATLLDLGFDVFQGFLFARPGFEHLPAVDFEAHADAVADLRRPLQGRTAA